jgi:uncharacterized membrane protein
LRAADAPPTGRLDDKYWILGSIYVNRADPSFFVERRVGVGWTLNFGNPRVVALFVVILAIPLLLPFVLIAVSIQ